MRKNCFLLAALMLLRPLASRADARDESIDYETQVKPLLARKCFACHGAVKRRGRLRLDAAPLIRKGGKSGPVVVPGDAAASLLVQRVVAEDPDDRMPPEGEGEPLTDAQVKLLRTWIDQGAVAADESIPPEAEDHWAFRPPSRARVPSGETSRPLDHPIDTLLAVQHAERGVTPIGPAPKETLLRRVFIDLIGLPPTRDQLHAFLDDPSPSAYEKVVDRLLDSPLHAERWARHWMDVWRYSDWAGYGGEIRYSQRHVWRWREWIVEALQADKGYDSMIVEMLAADELLPGDGDALRATGFLARNWYKFDRNAWLDQTVEHTFKAFLGMTANCARCHDHKYDPIRQEEYYRLRAIFEPYDVRIDRVPGELDILKNGVARIYDAKPDAATYVFERGDPKRADKTHVVKPGVPAVLRGARFEVRPIALPAASYYPALRDFVGRDMLRKAEEAVQSAQAELQKVSETLRSDESSGDLAPPSRTLAEKKLATAKAKLAALAARWSAERSRFLEDASPEVSLSSGAVDTASRSHEAFARKASELERRAALLGAEEQFLAAQEEHARAKNVRKEGDADAEKAVAAAEKKLDGAKKRLEEARKAAARDDAKYEALGPVYSRTSTGRRLALGRWIADRSNPLTARVAVNHIWLRHFGRPLVDNVSDFGLRSPRPLLAELLDDLAVEFMEHNWSMKHLHRLIVTSAAYRRQSVLTDSSTGDNPSAGLVKANLSKDPDNRTLWRMNPHRMEAEVVRDAILHVAGGLDLERGGSEIDQRKALTIPRRSLYFRHARQRQVPFLELFDAANPRECYRRRESIRPQQAFALVNSSLVLTQSRLVARRLIKSQGERDGGESHETAFVTAAFEAVLARSPSSAEVSACLEFLDRQRTQLSEPDKLTPLGKKESAIAPSDDARQRARENLILVLFNHHEFVTVR